MRAGRFSAATGALPLRRLHADWIKSCSHQSRLPSIVQKVFGSHVAYVWLTPLMSHSGPPPLQHACWQIDCGAPLVADSGVKEFLAFLGTVLPTASTASDCPVSGPQSTHSALMKSRVRFQGICNKAEPYCCSTPLRSERDRK